MNDSNRYMQEITRRLSIIERKLERFERYESSRPSMSTLTDAAFTSEIEFPRDIGAILVLRETGWDIARSLRYRAHDYETNAIHTLLPSGTIVHHLIVQASIQVRPLVGSFEAELYYANRIAVDSSAVLFQDTGHLLRLNVTAAGGLTVQRISGNHRYTVNFFMFWK